MSILPYTCVLIDAEYKDFIKSSVECFKWHRNQQNVIRDLQAMWTNPANQNHVLPCLSVRTGLDLFLQVKSYPAGSEVIMSAMNIPDMVHIVRHHGLKVVPLDVSIETSGPKVEGMDAIVTDKTVAVLIAHIFGKWCDINPIIDVARRRNLDVIEDCAEVFCGFERLGNPRCDINLFSFGIIKYCTAFGGAIAKVRDKSTYLAMCDLQRKYPVQGHQEYLKKVTKYSFVYILLDCPRIIRPLMFLTRTLNINHKQFVIQLLRGFPDQLINKIRHQPCDALLVTLRRRLKNFKQSDFNSSHIKAEYVRERLPKEATMVGLQAEVNNYWLFPILVENPDTVVKILNAMGIDSYRGATQLSIIEPEGQNLDYLSPYRYPHEARYIINQVVYLPVNKIVPFHVLDQICKAVHIAVYMSRNGLSPSVSIFSKL